MNLKCPGCNSTRTRFLDNYKVLRQESFKYFNDMKIFQCKDCELGFASPIPNKVLLSNFYKNVYRSSDSPHYVKNPQNTIFHPWYNAQFAYINQFVEFKEINNVLDIGPGYGFLLREIRRNNNKIKLTAADPDITSLEYLVNYNIKIRKILFDLEKDKINSFGKSDLILSSHSLEHMSNPRAFFTYIEKLLPPKGKMFLEIPNCPLTENLYLRRYYDSPHLLFFNKKSLESIIKEFNFQIINISTASHSYPLWIELQERIYKKFREMDNNKFKISSKKQLSKFLGRIRKAFFILLGKEKDRSIPLDYVHYQYGGQRWTLRAFLSKQ